MLKVPGTWRRFHKCQLQLYSQLMAGNWSRQECVSYKDPVQTKAQRHKKPSVEGTVKNAFLSG